MGAQRAAWQAAFAAELAGLRRLDHVQVLLDLVKAFETIPHDQLISAALAKGYSMCLLSLSLAAYRLQRTLGVDGHIPDVYGRREASPLDLASPQQSSGCVCSI